MKKKQIAIIVYFFLAAAGLLILVAGLSAQDRGRPEMTLFGGKTGTVDFKHHLHQDLIKDCQVCHKDFAKKQGALKAATVAGTLKKKQVMKKTCIQCHRAKKKAGEKTGPVSCKACHKK